MSDEINENDTMPDPTRKPIYVIIKNAYVLGFATGKEAWPSAIPCFGSVDEAKDFLASAFKATQENFEYARIVEFGFTGNVFEL